MINYFHHKFAVKIYTNIRLFETKEFRERFKMVNATVIILFWNAFE